MTLNDIIWELALKFVPAVLFINTTTTVHSICSSNSTCTGLYVLWKTEGQNRQAKFICIIHYYIFPSTQLQVIEITATCFVFNQPSFRLAYEPLLVTICICAFGIPDGLQFSYAYNVIVIYYFHVLGCVCCCLGSQDAKQWQGYTTSNPTPSHPHPPKP